MKPKIDFFIAGAAKSGTTSLFRYLSRHREIMSHQQPEMTFFSNDFENSKGFDYALERYFSGWDCNVAQKILAKDATAFYNQNFIQRLLKHNEKVKVVLVLRNPIDRAYSSYWYSRRRGWEDKNTFEGAIAAEAKRNNQKNSYWGKTAYLYRGVYYPHVKHLLEAVGNEQLRVVLLEDLNNNPDIICQDILEWLGLEYGEGFDLAAAKKHNIAGAPRSVFVARGFAWLLSADNPVKKAMRCVIPLKWSDSVKRTLLAMNDKPFTPPPMSEKSREWLRNYFQEHNQKLAELIKRDLSYWK